MPLTADEIKTHRRNEARQRDLLRSRLITDLIDALGSDQSRPFIKKLDKALEHAYEQGQYQGRLAYGK